MLILRPLFPEFPTASTAWEKFAAQPPYTGVSSMQKHTLLGVTKPTLSSRRGRLAWSAQRLNWNSKTSHLRDYSNPDVIWRPWPRQHWTLCVLSCSVPHTVFVKPAWWSPTLCYSLPCRAELEGFLSAAFHWQDESERLGQSVHPENEWHKSVQSGKVTKGSFMVLPAFSRGQ